MSKKVCARIVVLFSDTLYLKSIVKTGSKLNIPTKNCCTFIMGRIFGKWLEAEWNHSHTIRSGINTFFKC